MSESSVGRGLRATIGTVLLAELDLCGASQIAGSDETIKMTFAHYTARRDPVFERAVALAAD